MKFVDGWWWPDHEQHLLDWIANPKARLVMNGRPAYQGKKLQAALRYVKNFDTAVDIGAHIGLWSYNLSYAFAAVFAFEPVKAHRDCFEKNVTGQYVHLLPYALGEREDMVSIHTAETSTGDSWISGKGSIEQRTLDSFELPSVGFIKADAEGYEEFILRGAEKTIRQSLPVICVEQKREMARKFGLEPRGAVKFLQTLGYRVMEEISGDYICVPA